MSFNSKPANQVAITANATLVFDPGGQSFSYLMLKNIDAANTVFIGPGTSASTTLTATNGYPLNSSNLADTSAVINNDTTCWWGICGGGKTANIAYIARE